MPSDSDDLIREKLFFANPDKHPDEVEDFLNTIAQIESSGGKNLAHPEMQSGIHAGDSAAGKYGLMPNTIKEIAKRAELQGSATDPMRSLASIEDPSVMKQQLEQNPEVEQAFARQLAERVLNRQQDPEKAAYSWNQGHNLTPEQIQERDYQNSDYVKKFQSLRNRLVQK